MFDVVVRSMVVPACLCLGFLSGLTPAMAQSGAEAGSKHSYVVKSGDTLDKVVRSTYPNSPLRIELLRDEITQLNPSAFTKGNARMLMAGATLQMPAHEALLGKHLGKASASSTDNSVEARRHWVRYP